MKKIEIAKVVEQKEIATGIFSMWMESESLTKDAKAGQFISVYCDDKSKLLPRPISICQIDKEKNRLRIVYRIAGKGTEEISKKVAGDDIRVLGPLGNGYTISEGKCAILIGGGIGIPPMVELARELKDVSKVIMVAGYRDELFLTEEMEECGELFIATEDGSAGTKGTVIDAIKENNIKGDLICSCGPTPMLKAVKQYAIDNDIECFISLEERMACGIGACLACVCKTKEKDHHSNVNNKRICKDGPVFNAMEVEL